MRFMCDEGLLSALGFSYLIQRNTFKSVKMNGKNANKSQFSKYLELNHKLSLFRNHNIVFLDVKFLGYI